MKKIPIIICVIVLFSTTAFGQNFKAPVFEFRLKQHHEPFKIDIPKLTMKTPTFSFESMQLPFNNLLVGIQHKGIIILPLDNMPCFVPSVQNIIKMPISKENGYANNIPNTLNK